MQTFGNRKKKKKKKSAISFQKFLEIPKVLQKMLNVS